MELTGQRCVACQKGAPQATAEETARWLPQLDAGWEIVEIEYKRDPRNGAPKLLDINARYWAWHSLGRRTGVDFPYMQWRAAHGEAFPEMKMRTGGRWVRGLTDVMAAALAMRAGLLTPTRYLASIQPALEYAIFAFDDPMPFLADIPLMALRHVTG